jgi:hypothetical protein
MISMLCIQTVLDGTAPYCQTVLDSRTPSRLYVLDAHANRPGVEIFAAVPPKLPWRDGLYHGLINWSQALRPSVLYLGICFDRYVNYIYVTFPMWP